MTRFTPPISGCSLVDFSHLKSAADPPIGVARPDVVAHLCPRRVDRMSSVVPWKRRPRLTPFVIKGELVFDFFVRLAGIFMKAFVTSAIRRRVMFVGITGFHEWLLPVMFAPIFFFSRWIHSFRHIFFFL